MTHGIETPMMNRQFIDNMDSGMAEIQLDKQRIYYEHITGDADRPWLVFLHEGLGSTTQWKDFPHRLCELTGCRGLIYDRQGYGQSTPLNKSRTLHYLHEYALVELPQLLAALLPGQDYILVGHSDGGSIALIHAAARDPHLRGVITEAAHVFVEPETLDGIRAADNAYEQGKLAGLAKYHGDKTAQIFKAWSDTWLTPAFSHWNIEYLLPATECPLLVIQGEDDQYGSRSQVDSIAEGCGGPTQAELIPDCGHSPHHEQAEEVLALMTAFISSLAAAPESSN